MSNACHSPENVGEFTEKVGQIKQLVEELVVATPAVAKDAASQVKCKATQVGQQVVSTVRKYPIEVAAVAIGAGLLVWWLASRGSKSE